MSCQLLIEAKGITKVISIDDPKEKERDTAYELNLVRTECISQINVCDDVFV